MAAKLILAFASALLIQTISGQNTNAGIIDITKVGVVGNGIGLLNNAGGYGYGANYGSGYGLANAGAIDLTNIGIAGNGIGLANGGGYGNLGLANGISYGNLDLASSGIGASFLNNNYGYAAPSCGIAFINGYGANSNGGALPISSVSPLAPTGLTIISENAIDGVVNVNGALPFLSAIALEGQVGSGGSAGVQYNCGNGNVGIISENIGAVNTGLGYGAGLRTGYGASLGYGFEAPIRSATVNNYGSSCGCIY